MNIINSYEYTENNKPQYKVKCIICGATAVVSADELKSPCKCINTEKNDIIGNTYNNLFVYDVKSENMKIKCKCICQLCGQVTEVLKGNLLSGHTKSCGCLKERDLSGQVFGNLHVKTKTKKNGRTYYLCLCGVCGKTFLKREDSVLSATSCGCDRQEATIIAMHENRSHNDNNCKKYFRICRQCVCKGYYTDSYKKTAFTFNRNILLALFHNFISLFFSSTT